jgi:hypothetical protein
MQLLWCCEGENSSEGVLAHDEQEIIDLKALQERDTHNCQALQLGTAL